MRSLRPVLGLALLAAVIAVAPAGAANTVTYQDSTGEPGVKDITTIVVSNDDRGMVTFRSTSRASRSTRGRHRRHLRRHATTNAGHRVEPDIGGVDYVIQLLPRRGQPLQVGRHGLHTPLRRPACDVAHLPVGERRQHQDQRRRARQHEADAVRARRRVVRHRLQRDDRRARLHELPSRDFAPDLGRGFFATT